ncbi:MAG: hypothetical protein FI687_02405 [SAR202 cluster bacterium]|nr:hypothetical protein [SAR202 cluster bacterium]
MIPKNQQKLPLINMLNEKNHLSMNSQFLIIIMTLTILLTVLFFIYQTNKSYKQEITHLRSEINSSENLLLKKQEQLNDLISSIKTIETDIESMNAKVLIIGQELDQLVAGQSDRTTTYHSILKGHNQNLKILKILENSQKEIQIMGEAKNIENLSEFQKQLNNNLSIENLRWNNSENGLSFTAQITEN